MTMSDLRCDRRKCGIRQCRREVDAVGREASGGEQCFQRGMLQESKPVVGKQGEAAMLDSGEGFSGMR